MKFPEYFETYGGLNQLVKSRYLYAAILLTAACHGYFLAPEWWDLAIAVVPGLVGFSIAGVAIFVSLGSDSLRSVIAGKRAGECHPSPFIDFMAMFTHFIVVQLLALISAFMSKAFFASRATIDQLGQIAESLREPFWIFGGFCFCYAMLLCIALAVEIYRLAVMIDDFQSVVNEAPVKSGPGRIDRGAGNGN